MVCCETKSYLSRRLRSSHLAAPHPQCNSVRRDHRPVGSADQVYRALRMRPVPAHFCWHLIRKENAVSRTAIEGGGLGRRQMYPGKQVTTRASQSALVMAGTDEIVTYAELEARSNRL